MYVNKVLALSYLAGSEKIFNKLKLSFLDSYKNYKEDIINFYDSSNYEALYRYIHNILGSNNSSRGKYMWKTRKSLVNRAFFIHNPSVDFA